ncbi:antibiotic biosynthesis monooxygenase family protein [Bacillus sp. USDA818B3_A]|uniref:antibiotic biosynthesis monooxygenase family protein n=1 Tax=Bacillus sp. USDA818B3_A TaxID=2698834 RepID=UPI00136A3049|nr:antibiotic biosynthesis monooxygenase [Bacillus sp. USDA818B3_A]
MNIYITAGTLDYLRKIEDKYPNEHMYAMMNENGAVLLHETKVPAVFNEPRKYEVLESYGELKNEGFVVMNNISVSDEGRPLFEHQFKQLTGSVVTAQGLTALRLLRPLTSSPYIILTLWESKVLYQKWQSSNSIFDQLKAGFDATQKILTGTPYLSKYTMAGKN